MFYIDWPRRLRWGIKFLLFWSIKKFVHKGIDLTVKVLIGHKWESTFNDSDENLLMTSVVIIFIRRHDCDEVNQLLESLVIKTRESFTNP